MTTQTQEPSKPKSAYVDEAVQFAVDARWDEAADMNRYIIDGFGADEGAQNRLGKALTELGRLEEARAAYEASLVLNPMNTVARKNTVKLESLLTAKEAMKGGQSRVDLNLFVEEMGKTVTTTLRAAAGDVCTKIAAGDVAELRVDRGGIEIDTVRGVRVGTLELKLARRLIKLIRDGNRYQAGIMSCEGTTVRVIVRESYQAPVNAGKPSFPIVRRREAELRPYSRESLVNREADAFAGEDDDERPARTAILDVGEDDEGMHEVEEDESGIDFSEETAELDRSSGDEEEEDG
ncbi:MAG: tetratricopeptide repeat protein [Candidatus Dormibacteraeota bacterium]|nr:tetratricopeptide repeat protein [Candidatus Dormibacteraeota bacterium]